MDIIITQFNIGISSPFMLIHVTDTHLTYADIRDGERKVALAEKRKNSFVDAEKAFNYACKLAKEKGITIIHTGDLIDFVSIANLEKAKKINEENDIFMVAGNHEFAQYVGDAKEDADYRNQSLSSVQSVFKNNIRMSSLVINGINFVALDNGYYLFEEEQFDFLKKEVEKNLPIILLLHNPLYEPKLYDVMMSKSSCAYLVGVPESLMQGYSQKRFEQQRPDELTLKVIEYIKSVPNIKGIISGHLHFNYEGFFTENIPQIATSLTDIRLLEFK